VKTKPTLLAAAATLLAAFSPAAAAGPNAEIRFDAPIVRPGEGRLEGVLAKKEFAFRLPEHVRYGGGSELSLAWRGSPLLMDVSTLTVSLNGRQLASARVGHAAEGPESQDRRTLAAEIPGGMLQPGWNKVSIDCLLQTTAMNCRDVDNPAAWIEIDDSSRVSVSAAGQPLFAELQRFPDSIAEAALLELPGFLSPRETVPEPVVSLLLPWDAGDSELRTLLIAAARLGQTGYLPEEAVGIGDISEFTAVSPKRNGILIGLREELLELPLPAATAMALEKLGDGEGLLSEEIVGRDGGPGRRWVIVAGADPAGLEKAALSLGSSVALKNAPSNCWTVSGVPVVSPLVERLAHPPGAPFQLGTLDGGGLVLRGLFRNAGARELEFPPGYETAAGGFLDLYFNHAENLAKTSAFQVLLNDTPVGGVSLDAGNTGPSRRRMAVPAGISGRDPSLLAVSSYLDIGSTDCAHRTNERAWVDISGDSLIDLRTAPIEIGDLRKLDRILLRDAFLRRAALIVPGEPGGERDGLVKAIGMHLGSRLAHMPVLWPELATYSAITPPDRNRVASRSGVVLGSANQWSEAFGATARLVVEESASNPDRLLMRGEDVPKESFVPGISIAQLLPSPWGGGEVFAAVGGVSGFGGNNTLAMLTEPAVCERLRGTVAAYDGETVVTYDVRSVQEASLAEEFGAAFARGGGKGDPEGRLIKKTEAGIAAAGGSILVLSVAIVALGALFFSQRFMVRRTRKRHGAEEGGEL
jgi:hypothetical protein